MAKRELPVMILNLAVCAMLAGIGAAAAGVELLPEPATAEPVAPLAFTTASGELLDRPVFDMRGAFPGMKPELGTVTVTNRGDELLDYEVSVVVRAGARSLDDLLVVDVAMHGHAVYHGPLARLVFRGSRPIPPGSSVTYRAAISWPDAGAADNAHQGASLSFDIVVRGWSTTYGSSVGSTRRWSSDASRISSSRV